MLEEQQRGIVEQRAAKQAEKAAAKTAEKVVEARELAKIEKDRQEIREGFEREQVYIDCVVCYVCDLFLL